MICIILQRLYASQQLISAISTMTSDAELSVLRNHLCTLEHRVISQITFHEEIHRNS